MQSLAKLHAISQAIRDKSPGLFQEITSSLQPSGIKRQVDLDNKGVLVKILETHTPLFEEGCYEDIIKVGILWKKRVLSILSDFSLIGRNWYKKAVQFKKVQFLDDKGQLISKTLLDSFGVLEFLQKTNYQIRFFPLTVL